jgi:DNA primase
VPLSRFMLEAASEACDMLTAEGRAHMASNARALWSLLPDGALKRQLLAEIADQVQIDSRELLQLWQPAASYQGKARGARGASAGGGFKAKGGTGGAGQDTDRDRHDRAPAHAPDAYDGYPGRDDNDYANSEPSFYGGDGSRDGEGGGPAFTPYGGKKSRYAGSGSSGSSGFSGAYGDKGASARPRRLAGRILPASREDRVLRALLTEPQAWDKLSHEEHALLSALPAPHGPLFVWIEGQLSEHGPQPWAALREGLREHPHESYALSQLAQIPEGIESDWTEVRSILAQLSRLARQSEMQELALRAGSDPAALARYRELAEQQKSR